MPIYENKCNSCGKTHDIYRKVDERNNDIPICCGSEMQRVISASVVIGDIQPYQAVAVDIETGKAPYITSRSQHKEFLHKNGYIEVGNDLNNAKQRTEIRGDFEMKKEVAEATKKALANPANYY